MFSLNFYRRVKLNRLSKFSLIFFCISFVLGLHSQAQAQFGDIFGFGKNKVQYKSFKWSVIRTEHFDLYYYKGEREAAMDAAVIAERSYAYLSEILDYNFKKKIPLLLYASHNDFQQTNAIQGFISEGTQGVTESLKGRMVLPITGSYGQFVHVLTHEMVHAFQFAIMSAEDPADLVRRFNPPLWFIEGMAEYLSVGMDNITRMWMRDAILNGSLLSIPEMAQVFDIRVYRMGQAIWYYVGERYGKEVVGRIFKTARATGDINRAFKAHTGLDIVELSKRWHADARTRYLPGNIILQKPGELAKQVTFPQGQFSRISIVPSLSPDGKFLAYVGDKNFVLNLFLKELNEDLSNVEKTKPKKIVESGSSESYHTLRYFETSMNWSPDGSKFSFAAKAGANDAIYIVDAKKKKVIKKLKFKGITSLAAPSWSPDGKKLVFTGLKGGWRNLYIADEDGSNLVQLTNDRYTYLHPQWSPDGKKIAITTDRGPNTDVENMIWGNYNLALYDVESGEIELLTETGGNFINPVWTKDGKHLLFVSDMTGIPNIYSMDLQTHEIYRITNFVTGVAGIITQSPAITLARETNRLAFSAFWDGGWKIFVLDNYEQYEEKIDTPVTKVLEELEDPNEKFLAYNLPDSSEFLIKRYSPKLSPDLIVGSGFFASNVGFAGQSAFLFSDMLGDRLLLIQTALFGDPLESTIIVTYFNQKRRLNWAITGYQFRNDFGVFTRPDEASVESRIWRGVGLSASMPFTTFTRFDFNVNLNFLQRDVIRFNFVTGRLSQGNIGNAVFTTIGGSLVHDTSSWFHLSTPVAGTRARLIGSQNVGDLNWTEAILDFRKYIPISKPRYTLAYRLVAAGSFGEDRQIFTIGGPFTYRGADWGELFGTKAFFQNIEFRFPVFPYLPIQYDFLTALVFYDVGHAWFGSFDFNNSDIGNPIDTVYGFGIRLNMGGLLVLRWDFPINSEGPGTFFSIGTDF